MQVHNNTSSSKKKRKNSLELLRMSLIVDIMDRAHILVGSNGFKFKNALIMDLFLTNSSFYFTRC